MGSGSLKTKVVEMRDLTLWSSEDGSAYLGIWESTSRFRSVLMVLAMRSCGGAGTSNSGVLSW